MPEEPVLETDRLRLRPWRPREASVLRELWSERDPRVPPHRRLDAEGRPSVADLERHLREPQPGAAPVVALGGVGLLAVERRDAGDVVGQCGLVAGADRPGVPARSDEPELAVELLRRAWGRGYASEAGRAVLGQAAAAGARRVRATVWDWNLDSRRLLAALGFVETAVVARDPSGRTTLLAVATL